MSSVSRSRKYEPPSGSTTLVTPLSCARICCVRSASVAASAVGSASASSSEFVCSELVPPSTADSACSAVRMTLFIGCCAVSDTPAVWLWNRSFNERSLKLRFHSQTAGVSLTAQQPMNNVMRTALQALSAVLGGTNSLHTNSLDEALALPTAEAATLALRTQQILAYESGVTATVDPLGGSYFVEKLTQDMVDEAQRYFDQIDAMGGMVDAIE